MRKRLSSQTLKTANIKAKQIYKSTRRRRRRRRRRKRRRGRGREGGGEG
jgi:hypothetical protein